MAFTHCGAEIKALMKVSDDDVTLIEDKLSERLALGEPRAQAQRHAVADAIAMLNDERATLMEAIFKKIGAPNDKNSKKFIRVSEADTNISNSNIEKRKENTERYDKDSDPQGIESDERRNSNDGSGSRGRGKNFNSSEIEGDIREKESGASGRLGIVSAGSRTMVVASNLKDVIDAWAEAGLIKTQLSENKGVIHVGRIEVPKSMRNSGMGTQAMNQLIDYADATGQRIVLTPSTDFGGNKAKLNEFYKRFGFVENKGRNKDFTTRETMIREAKDENLSVAEKTEYTPTNGTEPASTQQQALADDLARRINAGAGKGRRVPTVLHAVDARSGSDPALYRSTKAVESFAKKIFGHNVVWVDFQGETLFRGAMSDSIPDTIFLDIKSDKSHMAVMGHELLHQLRKSAPDIYERLNERLNQVLKSDAQNKYSKALIAKYEAKGLKAPTNIDEELIGDIVGDNFVDPEFLQLLGENQPSAFRKVLDSIKTFLDDVIAKLTGANRPFGTDQYLTDLKAARQAVVIAMREFSGTQVGAMTNENVNDDVLFSGADKPLQTDTAAFKRWFGDSKVVNAQGKPQVMYHGTAADFDKFKHSRGDVGIHFGTTEQAADRLEYQRDSGVKPDDGMNTMPVYLAIKNPLRMSDAGLWNADNMLFQLFNIYPNAKEAIKALKTPKQIREFLQSKGHDGIVYKNTGEIGGSQPYRDRINTAREAKNKVFPKGKSSFSPEDQQVPEYKEWSEANRAYIQFRNTSGTDSYIAFSPTQVKSSIGNNGDFDASNPDIRFAVGGKDDAPVETKQSPWLDATNRLKFAPGQVAFDMIGKAINPILVRYQFKMANPKLRQQLRDMKLDVQKAQEKAVAVTAESMKLSDGDRLMVSDIIEKELKSGVTPPAHAVQLAAIMNAEMSKQSQELIRLGMLSADAVSRLDGEYLPRFYESKLTNKAGDVWADAMGKLKGKASPMKGIKGKSLHGRGMYKTIPESDLKAFEQLGWEVRDPDYNPSLPTVEGQVQVWRDYTRKERDDMGEIRDAGFRFVMGYMQSQKDIALGRMFEGMAKDPESSSRLEKEGWVKVPETKIEGTGAKRYGMLAGRFVPQETMSHLSQIEETQSETWQMYRKAMGLWKEGKTVLNPASHVNNIVSNLTMAHLAGVSYHRADAYMGAMKDFMSKAPMLKEANDAGLFLGSMSDAELMKVLPKELQALVVKGESAGLHGVKFVYNAMTFFLRKPLGEAYQAEDTFFRYLLYKDARQRGATPNEAVEKAQEAIFTYDDLPKGARMVRDFGIPFFAYTYKAVPMLLHTALVYPHRMAAPMAIGVLANAAAYAIAFGDDDDDWMEKLQKYATDPEHRKKVQEQEASEEKNLPPWMRGSVWLPSWTKKIIGVSMPKAIRLGMDELTGLPMFLDVSRLFPGGDLMDVHANVKGALPLPQPITPSHPVLTMLTGMMANKDLFTDKPLVDLNDDSVEATKKRLAWIWRNLSPAITIGNSHWERAMSAIAQASGGEITWIPDALGGDATGIGKDGNPVQPKYAIMQTFGIKVRPIDLDMADKFNANDKKAMLKSIDMELKKQRRNFGNGIINEKTMDAEVEKLIVKKDRIRSGLTINGDEKE